MAELNTRKRGKKWEYRFEGAIVDGKRNQISKGGFRTKGDAVEAGTKALAEYNQTGMSFTPTELSVADYLDYWYQTDVVTNCRYNTQTAYKGVIENHLKPAFGVYKLKGLNPAVIQEFMNNLKAKGYSKAMMINIISVLNGALDYAIEPMAYVQINPVRLVRFPKVDKKPREKIVVSEEQWSLILDRFKGTRFYTGLLIGFYTGLRISECYGLTWEDVDFINRTITVNKQIAVRNGNLHLIPPKTKTSARTIKIGWTLINHLEQEFEKQKVNEEQFGQHYYITVVKQISADDTEVQVIPKGLPCALKRVQFINVTECGEVTTDDSFKYCAKVIHYELEIPEFTFHCLRHTHATLLSENDANMKDVQARLGHMNISTTLQTYTHATDKMADKTVEIFENLAHDSNFRGQGVDKDHKFNS